MCAGQQHAVAEHVARHVADADHGEVVGVDVDAQGLEVELDRLPGAAGGDAHLLVVVALRAAGGEGVAQPEAAAGGDLVGGVGEGRRALVGGDHQVRVVAVVPDHPAAADHGAGLEVVGDVQHGADEHPVAGQHLALVGLAVGRVGQPLADEAALGAGRHDDRVLDLLGLGQAEDLGAEVLAPVRPAQAAPGDVGEPQVDALEPGRVDEQLELGPRRGQVGHLGRVQLDDQVRDLDEGPGEVVGAQRRADQLPVGRAGCGPRPGWRPRPARRGSPRRWPRCAPPRRPGGPGRSGTRTAGPAAGSTVGLERSTCSM